MRGRVIKVNGGAKERLFTDAGAEVHINGEAKRVGFQDSHTVKINGGAGKCNFGRVQSTVTVNGSAKKCVFTECAMVTINGSAKKCVFVGMTRKNIRINGSIHGCTLNGEPLEAPPRSGITVSKGGYFGGGNVVIYDDDDGEPTITEGGGIFSGRGHGSISIGGFKGPGNVSWGNISIRGAFSMPNGTIKVSAGSTGSIEGIPVSPKGGIYVKRAGTIYRQDLSASPSDSASWQVYDAESGTWVSSGGINPTLTKSRVTSSLQEYRVF